MRAMRDNGSWHPERMRLQVQHFFATMPPVMPALLLPRQFGSLAILAVMRRASMY